MIEVDACAPADDGLDVAVLAVDIDVCAGIAVVLVEFLGANSTNFIGVVLAEGLLGGDDDAAGVAGFLPFDIGFDRLEEMARTECDHARLDVLLFDIDTLVFCDLAVGGVDELVAFDRACGVGESDEIAVRKPIDLRFGVIVLRFRLRVGVGLSVINVWRFVVTHTTDDRRSRLKNNVSCPPRTRSIFAQCSEYCSMAFSTVSRSTSPSARNTTLPSSSMT